MPSLLYANSSAPFWDFVASLEQQGSQHPFFRENRDHHDEREHEQNANGAEYHGPPAFGPGQWGRFFDGGNGIPYRGHPSQQNDGVDEKGKEKDKENDQNTDNETPETNDVREGPPDPVNSDSESRAHGNVRNGRCSGRRGRCGPGGRGDFRPHHGPPHRGGPWGRARWGPWGRGGFGGGFDLSALAEQFWNPFNNHDTINNSRENGDHKPDADVFDADSAFVIHVSVPGAKKEDVGVNWDPEKSELSVAGVIYRLGDEEFLKTLAINERKVGAFEKKIRLGTRANPAHIDAEGITAKLEDGVLIIQVPKLDSGYVEIRKVDIE